MACQGGFDFTGLLPYLMHVLDIALTIVGLIPAPVPIAGQAAWVADASTIILNSLMDDPIAVALSAIALVPLAGEFD